ncbi:hypothetical protein B9Z55_029048 [Caenorhabditis nigoni]|uniref:Uncharacterized protein n=1 Tax=Caenorhabditis nigoni TaxID=1611254 RepID=A0A2G5S8R8_9PELO|nr:hypothetical protein B9Z55_029048 [Caenorhabditis nigoni]
MKKRRSKELPRSTISGMSVHCMPLFIIKMTWQEAEPEDADNEQTCLPTMHLPPRWSRLPSDNGACVQRMGPSNVEKMTLTQQGPYKDPCHGISFCHVHCLDFQGTILMT